MEPLILVINPGSASRKYALFKGSICLARFHFEYENKKIVCTYEVGKTRGQFNTRLAHLTFAPHQVIPALIKLKVIKEGQKIDALAVRLVAPSSYFQEDRLLDGKSLRFLKNLEQHAPLHINALLQEINFAVKDFPGIPIIGISDSAFHKTMPDHARSYAIPGSNAAQFDLWRFGYHGISVASAVKSSKSNGSLPKRLIVCHLGSGVSVTAVRDGKGHDTTMGYSPLEGPLMATRSGSLDITAALALKKALHLSDQKLLAYLNDGSGLLGVSGASNDIRVLLELEREKNERASLSLRMYVYKIQQAIGQMSASLGGVDALVFTGIAGERSAEIRRRIVSGLLYLGLALDAEKNHENTEPGELILISPAHHPGKIYIKPTDEDFEIAERATALV